MMLFQATEVLSKMYAAHQEGQKNAGIDLEVTRYINYSSQSSSPVPELFEFYDL